MRKMFASGAAAALLALAAPTGEAKAQFFNLSIGGGGFYGPYNSGYGIYAPGYSRGLSYGGFGNPYFGGGFGNPYSYGAYRPYYGGYGYQPYYGGYNGFRSYNSFGGYRGGFYGRRW